MEDNKKETTKPAAKKTSTAKKTTAKSKTMMDQVKDEVTKEENVVTENDITADLGEIAEFFESADINFDEVESETMLEGIYNEDDDDVLTNADLNPEKVDLTSLTINSSKNALEISKDIKHAIYSNKSAFQIILTQSAYMAFMLPLTNRDVIKMLNTNMDRYNHEKELFMTLHSKIYKFGFDNNERMDFETWLDNTSLEDVNTYYYGVYCASFPEKTSYDITCGSCVSTHAYSVPHNNLIGTVNDLEIKDRLKDIKTKISNIESAKKASDIRAHDSYKLKESSIIIQTKTPSLSDYLKVLNSLSEKELEDKEISVTNLIYISRMLVPDPRNIGDYTEVKDQRSIINILKGLSVVDTKILTSLVKQSMNKNRLKYSIKNLTCASCGEKLDELPINIGNMLFQQIFEETQL